MTIALLRLYMLTSHSKKTGQVFNVGVSFFATPQQKVSLGKNPVTIDDYRATAFVQKKNKQSQKTEKRPYHFVNLKTLWKTKPKVTGVFKPARPVFAPPKRRKIVTFLGWADTNILIYNPVTVNFLLGEKVTFMP